MNTDERWLATSFDLSSARAFAISAGDLSTAVTREVKQALQNNKNDVLKSVNSGLERLVERQLISTKEFQSLKTICTKLVYAIRRKEDADDAFLTIRAAYQTILLESGSSPVALAIASVANAAFEFEKTNSVNVTPMSTGAGSIAGAVIGGVIGGIIGGGIGAGFGAAIGGAAGAAIGWCNEQGK